MKIVIMGENFHILNPLGRLAFQTKAATRRTQRRL
jgi:hypothetical protein